MYSILYYHWLRCLIDVMELTINFVYFLNFSANVTVEGSAFKVSPDDAVIKNVPAVSLFVSIRIHVTFI